MAEAVVFNNRGVVIVSAEDAEFVRSLILNKKVKWSREGIRMNDRTCGPFLARIIAERALGHPIPEHTQVRRYNKNKIDVRRENLFLVKRIDPPKQKFERTPLLAAF